MHLWALTLLFLFASVGAIEIRELSLTAQKPFLRNLQIREDGLVYSSMCIGSEPELVRRCLISAARWRHVVKERDIPLIYYVKDLPPEAATYLKSLYNVHVVELSEMEWLPSERYPTAPPRFYSFYKLAAFNLYGYRVFWFDSDAYLFQNPTFLFDLLPKNATGEELVAWNAAAKNHFVGYFNSGFMVFKPTRKVTKKIYDVWASGEFDLHAGVSEGIDIGKKITEQEVLLSVFAEKLIPLPNCLNFRSHAKYSRINRGCNISQIVAFHDWEAFATDMERFCFFWKKAMLLGSSPLLCDVDTLAPGAPRFTLEDCSPYFAPPSKTNLCDPTSPYSPSFRPTEEEIRQHFNTRRRFQLRALEELTQMMKNKEEKRENEKKGEDRSQVLIYTYSERADPTSELYTGPKIEEPEMEKEDEEEDWKEVGGEEKVGDGKHHYLDKFRHHDKKPKDDGTSGGEDKKKDKVGGEEKVKDGKHHYLDKFRHHSKEQENEKKSDLGSSRGEKVGGEDKAGDGKHHYLDKFRHHDKKSKDDEASGGKEKKSEVGGEEKVGDRKHHFLDKFRHHSKEQKGDGATVGGEEKVDGKHFSLDKFRWKGARKK